MISVQQGGSRSAIRLDQPALSSPRRQTKEYGFTARLVDGAQIFIRQLLVIDGAVP
jgi:hypothetical protein